MCDACSLFFLKKKLMHFHTWKLPISAFILKGSFSSLKPKGIAYYKFNLPWIVCKNRSTVCMRNTQVYKMKREVGPT